MIVRGKSPEGLVKHAERALKEHWWYVWGTVGWPLTADRLKQCVNRYPTKNTYAMHRAHLGEMVCDCVGLIKSYYMWNDAKDEVDYRSNLDYNTGMMYNGATVKGPIATIPERPGVCVYKRGHVGVYAGGGRVIECAWQLGVIETPLKGGTKWTHWFECPFIEYGVKVGDKVKIKPGSPDYNDRPLASWTYGAVLEVMEIRGNRVVVGINGQVTAAVNKIHLIKQ